ncbi:hypothetical protein DSECCO2_491510 [anaerobic digester metagenome]
MAKESGRMLSVEQRAALISVLRTRFQENMGRHKDLDWVKVEARLKARPDKLWSLHEMERTGGEPDVVGCDRSAGAFILFDCSKETPKGRRNVCYDQEGQDTRERKGVHPAGNALSMAEAMGVDLLTEEQYRELQRLGSFDTKTSSWIRTPANIRTLGGALFADRRYGHVFVYHNSAPSFYSSRGFRGSLRV